jgi:hypothetical protein
VAGLINATSGLETAAWIGLTSLPPSPSAGHRAHGLSGGGTKTVGGGRWTDGCGAVPKPDRRGSAAGGGGGGYALLGSGERWLSECWIAAGALFAGRWWGKWPGGGG